MQSCRLDWEMPSQAEKQRQWKITFVMFPGKIHRSVHGITRRHIQYEDFYFLELRIILQDLGPKYAWWAWQEILGTVNKRISRPNIN